MIMPDKLKLANLPTRIERLDRMSAQLGGPTIYIKRDDQTGTELTGNKIRKLEYVLGEAVKQGADTLITCGGVQSNHCRTTAAAAAKLGLKTILLLQGNEASPVEGNYLLDLLFGAEIRWVSEQDYRTRRNEMMQQMKEEAEAKGHHAYIIPEGASSGIGAFGYYAAMEEILQEERKLQVSFDAVVIAMGSGGTYAGLFMAQQMLNTAHQIIGINVSHHPGYFQGAVAQVLHEAAVYLDKPFTYNDEDIRIIDGYVGRGYAAGSPEERALIRDAAGLEGILLDPVYTGKAFYGLVQEIGKGRFAGMNNILFIHTGGLFGLFPQGHEFQFVTQ